MKEIAVRKNRLLRDSIRAASSIAYGQVRSPTPSSSPRTTPTIFTLMTTAIVACVR